jgi:hypothetical protein
MGNRKSSVVDRLKQSLRDENITFEDVKNILIRDREELCQQRLVLRESNSCKILRTLKLKL